MINNKYIGLLSHRRLKTQWIDSFNKNASFAFIYIFSIDNINFKINTFPCHLYLSSIFTFVVLTSHFSTNPMQLFTYVRQCLATEMRLIQAASGEIPNGLPNIPISNVTAEVARQVDILRHRTEDTAKDLRKLEEDQESFALQYHECTKINGKFGKINDNGVDF